MAGQQYQEGQRLQGSDGKVYVVRGGVPVADAPASRAGIISNLPADSLTAQTQQVGIGRTQAETTGQNLKNNITGAEVPYADRKAAAEAGKAELDAKGLDASVRQKALAQYAAARQLDATIADMKAKFAAGPGATHGINGVADYFSTPANSAFDSASDAGRGIVRNALGLTGGESNTLGEAQLNLGSYNPHSKNWDNVILDSIGRLENLRDNARASAIQTLGGIPDQNGVVTPAPTNQKQRLVGAAGAIGSPPGPPTLGGPPSGSPPPGGPNGGPSAPLNKTSSLYDPTGGGTGGGMALAQGNYTQQYDPQTSSQIDGMIRSGFSADRINAALKAGGKAPIPADQMKTVTDAQQYLALHPDYKGSFANSTKSVPIASPGLNQFQQSAPGVFLDQASDAATFGNKARLAGWASGGSPDLIRGGMADAASQHPIAAIGGNLAGGAAAAAGLETGLGAIGQGLGFGARWIPRAADAAYGGITGASSADPGNGVEGGLVGTILGAGGGMFGRAATRTAGRALKGVTDPDVTFLARAGVPLTLGQAAGGAFKGIEDKLTSVPIIGDMISARRREGFDGFANAAFNRGLAPIGGKSGGVIGPEGVESALQQTGQAFDNALGNKVIPIDTGPGSPWADAVGRGAGTPTFGGDFSTILEDHVNPLIAHGALPGRAFQALDRTLDGNARQYNKIALGTNSTPPAPMAGRVGGAFQDLGDALTGAVQSADPSILPDYANAKTAYRNTKILQSATDKARNGSRSGIVDTFTPSQLSDAASANARVYGGTQGTTNQPFFDLTRAGQRVLPSSIPDSGTGGRLAQLAMLGGTGGVGGGIGYATTGDKEGGAASGLAGLTTASLLSTKIGQKALVNMLLKRPSSVVRAGEKLDRLAPYIGMFGAGASTQLLPGK